MKLLTVIQRYYPVIGGSENLTKNLMDHMSKTHKVTVYTTLADDIQSFWYPESKKIQQSHPLNYEVKHYDFLIPTEIKHDSELNQLPVISNHPGPFSPKLWNDLVIEKIDFDLIFSTAFPYDHILPAYVSAKKWKIPIIVMPLIHQEFPELFLTSLKLTILNNSDAIITLSKSEKNLLIENGVKPEKISIIPPTVTPPSAVKLTPSEFRSKKLPNFNGKIVLFIGTKSSMKGTFHLIDAMKQVWKNHSDVKLVLIGSSSPEFETFFSELSPKYKNRILDLGVVNEDEKNEALSACDIFALPSKSESFGLVYIEAWLHSKPVIGCKLRAIEEVIDNQKNGILTEFGNIPELVKAITFLIENPQEAQKFGKEGKIRATEFTSGSNATNFEKICIDVIHNFNQ